MFNALDYACVYAIGPEKGRPLKVGATGSPQARFSQIQTDNWREMLVHEIVWTLGPPLANRLQAEIHRILTKAGRHIRGEWFDVPVEYILPTFQVATDNTKVETFTHEAMIERVAQARQARTRAEYAQAMMGLPS
jgi:hypothetical protein